ncbi:MAG: hypothetical protein II882_06545 [Lachnospiraceae bacterium]|nr:hypothetical protein [Lachnospiraceae bacterium]
MEDDRVRKPKSSKKEGARILPFRRNITVNIGLIVFLFIFLYLAVFLIRYATRQTYSSFTVGMPESLTESKVYTALILRDEETFLSDWAGNVDMYAASSGHVRIGMPVVSVDEIGSYSDTIRESASQQALGKEDLLALKAKLKNLSVLYNIGKTSSIYEEKLAISTYFQNNIGTASLAALEDSLAYSEFFHVLRAGNTGLVLYYRDGYEDVRASSLKADDFTGDKYKRENTASLVTSGDFLYKLVESENWQLIVPLTAQEAAFYGALSSVRFSFIKNGISQTAPCMVLTGADGSYLLQISLSRFLIRFASERYTEIRIDQNAQSGYKIPRSALVTESFYLIPREYEIDDPEVNGKFLAESYSGQVASAQLIDPTVYYRDDNYCYVSRSEVPEGTVLAATDSSERFTVRLNAFLNGVYLINTGYTHFCPIEILDEDAEYFLVSTNLKGGLSTYDTILLNADRYKEGQVLN